MVRSSARFARRRASPAACFACPRTRSALGSFRDRLAGSLDALSRLPLPAAVRVSVPEGYACYALYPETYLEAAAQFMRDARPRNAAVIGIRSIGTSLSAVVCAEAEVRGCAVRSFTVRPRGHPFDRRLALSPSLTEALRRLAGRHFLVVDEGPGLSWSSFASVAGALSELGAPDERVVLLPSGQADGEGLVSATARERWRRHRKYTGAFEHAWHARDGLVDLSGCRWRSLLYGDRPDTPAVQPQHERRKYLDPSAGVLFEFAGLGRYGRAELERAAELAGAGFAPRPLGLSQGFLAMEFIEGRPVSGAEVGASLLDSIARYLAFLAHRFPASQPVPFDDLLQMMRVNAGEALGEEWVERVEALERLESAVGSAGVTALDGRMLPHEWIATAGRYLKTDGLDHHDDHFYPGCQDIAWDIAGTCVEFRLEPAGREYLFERYESLSGDSELSRRLPFYMAAYAAYRLGYSTLAAGALPPSPDRASLRRWQPIIPMCCAPLDAARSFLKVINWGNSVRFRRRLLGLGQPGLEVCC